MDFLYFKGFLPSLADLKGMIIPPPAERGGMIIPLRSARGGMNIPLSLDKKDMIKKNDVPPTRGRESMGFPSPRAVPRGACGAPGLRPSALRRPPSGQPSGKENPYSPSLLLEVHHSFSSCLFSLTVEKFQRFLNNKVSKASFLPSLRGKGKKPLNHNL